MVPPCSLRWVDVARIAAVVAGLAAAGGAQGTPGAPPVRRLTGDWGGLRSDLEERGLTFEGFYAWDVLSNVEGGARRGTELLGNVDVLVTTELGPLLNWEGGRAFVYGLANHGDAISSDVGDVQGTSNIEAPDRVRLYEAWLEQEWGGGRWSLLAGRYDVNSEFDVMPSAGLFLHSSHGMGAELGNSGRNGPSVFPVTALALRAQWRPDESIYLRALVADGVPGDPLRPASNRIDLSREDGALIAGEVGLLNLPSPELRGRVHQRIEDLPLEERRYGWFGKYAVGVWGYTGEVGPGQGYSDPGFYVLAEQRVWFDPDDPFQGITVFARAGMADDKVSPFDAYVGSGLVWRGLIPGRPRDRLGLAVAAAHFGDTFRRGSGTGWDDWEIAFELTWRAPITGWLSIQPDVQYVVHPGGDPSLDDAVVLGVRGVVSF